MNTKRLNRFGFIVLISGILSALIFIELSEIYMKEVFLHKILPEYIYLETNGNYDIKIEDIEFSYLKQNFTIAGVQFSNYQEISLNDSLLKKEEVLNVTVKKIQIKGFRPFSLIFRNEIAFLSVEISEPFVILKKTPHVYKVKNGRNFYKEVMEYVLPSVTIRDFNVKHGRFYYYESIRNAFPHIKLNDVYIEVSDLKYNTNIDQKLLYDGARIQVDDICANIGPGMEEVFVNSISYYSADSLLAIYDLEVGDISTDSSKNHRVYLPELKIAGITLKGLLDDQIVKGQKLQLNEPIISFVETFDSLPVLKNESSDSIKRKLDFSVVFDSVVINDGSVEYSDSHNWYLKAEVIDVVHGKMSFDYGKQHPLTIDDDMQIDITGLKFDIDKSIQLNIEKILLNELTDSLSFRNPTLLLSGLFLNDSIAMHGNINVSDIYLTGISIDQFLEHGKLNINSLRLNDPSIQIKLLDGCDSSKLAGFKGDAKRKFNIEHVDLNSLILEDGTIFMESTISGPDEKLTLKCNLDFSLKNFFLARDSVKFIGNQLFKSDFEIVIRDGVFVSENFLYVKNPLSLYSSENKIFKSYRPEIDFCKSSGSTFMSVFSEKLVMILEPSSVDYMLFQSFGDPGININQILEGFDLQLVGLKMNIYPKDLNLNVEEVLYDNSGFFSLEGFKAATGNENNGITGDILMSFNKFDAQGLNYSKNENLLDLSVVSFKDLFFQYKEETRISSGGSLQKVNSKKNYLPVNLKINDLSLENGHTYISASDSLNVSCGFRIQGNNLFVDRKLLSFYEDNYDASVFVSLNGFEANYKYEKVRIKNLSYSSDLSLLEIHDISYAPEPSAFKKETKMLISNIHLPSVSIEKLDLIQIFEKKEFNSGSITITGPRINVLYNQGITGKSAKVHAGLQKDQNPFIQRIDFDNIRIAEGSLTLGLCVSDSQIITHELYPFKIKIESLKASHDDNMDYLHSMSIKDLGFTIPSFSLCTKDSTYNIGFKAIELKSLQHSLEVDSFYVSPNFNRYDFSRRIGYQTDRMKVSVPHVSIDGFDHADILKGKLKLGQVFISNAYIEGYRDKRVSFPEWQRRKMPVSLLNGIQFPLCIDSVKMVNSYIKYLEQVKGSKFPGDIYFEDFNANIYNVCNRKGNDSSDFSMQVHLTTKIMGEGELTSDIHFPLKANNDTFQLKATLEPMELTSFSEMTRNLFGVEIRRGSGSANIVYIRGNNNYAHGFLEFPYQKLRISLYNREKGKKRGVSSEIVSFLANEIVIKSNNPRFLRKLKIGEMYFDRNKKKSFFNFIWRTTLTGIESSLGFENKALRRYQKEKSNSLKQRN